VALTLNPGVSEDTLDAVMQAPSLDLPHDYREFLRASNGGEGLLGRIPPAGAAWTGWA